MGRPAGLQLVPLRPHCNTLCMKFSFEQIHIWPQKLHAFCGKQRLVPLALQLIKHLLAWDLGEA